VNYRLKNDDIAYIFRHAEVEAIVVDREFCGLLESLRRERPGVSLIVDWDVGVTGGQLGGPFEAAVQEGLRYDEECGSRGWGGLEAQAPDENELIALSYTSGTTARPKGVEYTHRGCYLAALGNAIESGLNREEKRCRYLWTLPMFHAMGESAKAHTDREAVIDLQQDGRSRGQ
jgi:long-subunit acyl-CoA synthetase (AMP-forming)